MRCSEAANQLQLYIDGQLPMERTRALEGHLTECASCQSELRLLEEVVGHLESMQMVAEPQDLSTRIMQCVAVTPQKQLPSIFELLRPSVGELAAAIVLATIASLGTLLGQPALRELLPNIAHHDLLGALLTRATHLLASMDATTLTLALWVVGTLLGVCITLIVAGEEMRSRWLRAVWERLPVLR
jgi:anti-sigma factor RsiW